jgi:hypothetical protein
MLQSSKGNSQLVLAINSKGIIQFQVEMKKAVPSLKRLVAGFPPWQPRFDPRSGQVGLVVDKVALGQVFSKYFGFP